MCFTFLFIFYYHLYENIFHDLQFSSRNYPYFYCYCLGSRWYGMNQLTLKPSWAYYEIPRKIRVGVRKEGEETPVLCVRCDFQRGDRVSTHWLERASTRRYRHVSCGFSCIFSLQSPTIGPSFDSSKSWYTSIDIDNPGLINYSYKSGCYSLMTFNYV